MSGSPDRDPRQLGGPPPEFALAARFANAACPAGQVGLLDDGAGRRSDTRNELTQDLIGWGRFGAMFSLLVGMLEVRVAANEVDAARRVLGDLEPDGDST